MSKKWRKVLRTFEMFTRRSAQHFVQHSFDTKLQSLGDLPKVLISRRAYNKMWHYVDMASKEVGWLGTIEERGNDFLITDVFLPKQEVTGASAEITSEGLAELGEELLKKSNGAELCNALRFWGHSHAEMGTSPSGQDDRQMEVLRESEHPYFIRGILNKSGRMQFTIFLYYAGIKIEDAEWNLCDPADESIREEIEKEFNDKVSEYAYRAKAGNGLPGRVDPESWKEGFFIGDEKKESKVAVIDKRVVKDEKDSSTEGGEHDPA